MKPTTFFDTTGSIYQKNRMDHWDSIARKHDTWRGMGKWYHQRLHEIYRFHVSPNQRVLELGCATGDLLAAVQPQRGVGIDFSQEMIQRARAKYPHLEFIHADAHDLAAMQETFDVIILSDLVNDLWDVQRVLEQLKPLCQPHTRVILNAYSRLWQAPLGLARTLNLATSNLFQNWLTPEDIRALLLLTGFEPIRTSQEILWPLPLGGFANRFLVRLWPFREIGLSNLLIARPAPQRSQEPIVSVIVPARNESGNIKAIFERTPQMGRGTELVFVEGHSKDDTYAAI